MTHPGTRFATFSRGKLTLSSSSSMTVAHTLSSIAFHVINIKKVLHKLQEELASVAAEAQGPVKWNRLEQLPYLVSLVQKSNRYPSDANRWSIRLRSLQRDCGKWKPLTCHLPIIHTEALLCALDPTKRLNRWSNGVSHRLQRISPDVDLHYQGYLIPRGVSVLNPKDSLTIPLKARLPYD